MTKYIEGHLFTEMYNEKFHLEAKNAEKVTENHSNSLFSGIY